MEEMILAGRITVNRMPAEVGQKVGPGDEVRINGEPVKIRFAEPKPRVLLYHKPAGELVTRDDPEDRPTVFEDLPSIRDGKWIAVGRLDYNTEDNYDLNKDGKDDLILNFYSHQKYLTIQGTYDGVPGTEMLVTGSANWASLSPANDEVRMTIRGSKVTRKYVRNFDYQWKKKRNSRNAYTTTYANFRVRRTVRQPDGTMRTVWRTVRRPVTTVEPDRYLKGPYWEAD